jgi:hypothetical protein
MSSSDRERDASIRDFLKRFNTDDEFRENVLNDPVGHFERLGWTNMTDIQKRELREVASEVASEIRKGEESKYRIDITDQTVILRFYARI